MIYFKNKLIFISIKMDTLKRDGNTHKIISRCIKKWEVNYSWIMRESDGNMATICTTKPHIFDPL